MEMKPQEAAVEQGLKEIEGIVKSMKSKDRSICSGGDDGGGSSSSTSSPYPDADIFSLSSLICKTNNACLLYQAFSGHCVRLELPIIEALKLIRDNYVNSVARVMEKPLTFTSSSDEMQQGFKFEGLDVVVLEEPAISACVKVTRANNTIFVVVVVLVVVVVVVVVAMILISHSSYPRLKPACSRF
jgi:hypothetical protein